MRFTGHERDLADDIDYVHTRHYKPLFGRFLSLDSVGGTPAAPQSWNRYAYVQWNPLKLVDHNGKCAAPAGLEAGQVGVCVEAFIAAPHIFGFGLGDDRTFARNDRDLTARVSFKAIIDPKTGDILNAPVPKPGHSDVMIKGLGQRVPLPWSVNRVTTPTQGARIFRCTSPVRMASQRSRHSWDRSGFNVNMNVSSSGDVKVDPSSKTKGYPSIAGHRPG